MPRKQTASETYTWRQWLLILVLVGVPIALLLPQKLPVAGERARQSTCECMLKQIGVALENHNDVHGRYPPAQVLDEAGRPMHSWRMLVAPFMELQQVYDDYRFEEPWDSPHNRTVIDRVSGDQYHCPSDRVGNQEPDWSETSYVMITGPGMLSDGTSSARSADKKPTHSEPIVLAEIEDSGVRRVRPRKITDLPAQTIMVVEVTNSGIHWAEPRDLKADEISFKVNDPNGKGIRSNHDGGVNFLFCDGDVHFIEDATPPELIKAMATIAGGENLDEFFKQFRREP